MSVVVPFHRASKPTSVAVAPLALDPRRVEELCAAEPWMTPPQGKMAAPSIGEVPEKFRRLAAMLPEDMPVRQEFLDAADRAEAVYRRQIESELDGETVEAFCAREPWCNKNLSQYNNALFGYVPERYEEAARRFAGDEAKAAGYRNAHAEASALYHRQMKQAAQSFADGKSRIEVEQMSSQLWQVYKPQFEEGPMGPSPLISAGLEGTILGARLLWMAHVIGHICMGYVPKPGMDQADGVAPDASYPARVGPIRRAAPVEPVPTVAKDLFAPLRAPMRSFNDGAAPKSPFAARLAAARKQQERHGGPLRVQPCLPADDADEPLFTAPSRQVQKRGSLKVVKPA